MAGTLTVLIVPPTPPLARRWLSSSDRTDFWERVGNSTTLVGNLHSFGYFSTINKGQKWWWRTVWIRYKIWTGVTSPSEQDDISFGKTYTATWYKFSRKTTPRISSRRAATVVTKPVSMVNLVNLTRFNLLFPKLDLDGRSCEVRMSDGLEKKIQTDTRLVLWQLLLSNHRWHYLQAKSSKRPCYKWLKTIDSSLTTSQGERFIPSVIMTPLEWPHVMTEG